MALQSKPTQVNPDCEKFKVRGSRLRVQASVLAFVFLALGFSTRAALTPEQIKSLPPPAAEKVVFARDIKPIFESSCIKCHARGRSKGGLQLDTRATLLHGGDSGPAVVPGKSQQSLLIELVSGLDPDNVMPKKGTRLTPTQVGLLRAWIDSGLQWDPKITFARPAPLNLTPHLPKQKVSLNSKINPIDQLLKPYFEKTKFKSPQVVEDHVFARRAYLDVIGLLPTTPELDAFVTQPARASASTLPVRATLVHHLLSENAPYTENWLSFWNDLLRNDYRGTGYIDGGRKQISKWLYSVLNTNLAYDQFVSRLVNPTPECEGFVKGIVWRGTVNASQSPSMQAAQNVSQIFMGVNLKCASCHDSFINDWRLVDSYGLASVYGDGALEMFLCDKPTGQKAMATFIYPELGEMDPKADRSARLKRVAEIMTGPKDGRLSRTIVNRLWARFFGRGLIEPVDDMEQVAWNQDLLDWLAEDLVANHYDLKKTIERILTSRAYQLPSVDLGETTPKDFVFRGPGIRRMSAEQFRDAIGQITEVWFAKNEISSATNQQARAALAPADPLTTALGRPNREQVLTTRASAATTLQALELTNGETLAKILHKGAANLASSSLAPDELVEQLYRQSLGRHPSAVEKSLARDLLGDPVHKEGVEDLLWAIVMLPDFQLIY
ncbi:MAG: hypothetical protein C5B50_04040 [Verrucomicrobia bacterium]|nr:MAG: hypothetical protein C5B50_04040 [Verrucomicrobiota bacterium]